MKLIVQIPCYNEEETLPLVVNSIPREIEGVDSVEILIIDDGSKDRTLEVAEELGVDHIVRHRRNQGLAKSFSDGIDRCLELGADIVVNTDGDNQYPQQHIPDLIKPILNETHDIVIGDRQTHTIEHFSALKKKLQKLGSWVVNKAAGTDIPDAVSGFRAYSKKSLLQLNVVTDFSYCTETIIHAGQKRIAITSVPVETNEKTRESRLFNNMWEHIYRSSKAIFRSYAMNKPFRMFAFIGFISLVVGVIPFIRFLLLFFISGDPASGHIQSLVFGAVFVIIAFILFMLGVVTDLISVNRRLLEDSLKRIKEDQYKND